LDTDSVRSVDSDPDSESGPDPGGQKLPTIIEKSSENFLFRSAGCSPLRDEGFSCSLDVLYGGLGISKLQFLIYKKKFQL
jgi:hypothetical protein